MKHIFAEDVVDTARSTIMSITMPDITTISPTFISQSNMTRNTITNAKPINADIVVINMPTTVTNASFGRGSIAVATSTTTP
ncbi:hypothetical protein CEP54_006929 [Fusarium duplospermum]|uniref:Uncharacterized protein n=1 Tax=Fusarium duplospermum TaxID=1325734 RepID=A0A428Q4I0_9HYPO|nr:hypothetical protein CEP54_006929 [Fusarium duplospermum]